MIIHQPEITIKNGQIKVAARIETVHQRGELPETLWFAFPESYADYVTDRSDGFLSTLLLIAMYLGEDIEVRGTVSPQLALNMQELVPIYAVWQPRVLTAVSIQYDRLKALSPGEVAGGVAVSFSGGIDSFYALWRNLPENQPVPEARLTHGLFIHGLDILLEDGQIYQSLYQQYARIFSRQGLVLLKAESNMLRFYRNRVDWDTGHNGPQIGLAQVLGRLFSRFYKPGGGEYAAGRMFVNLYSTETLDVSIHAATLGRADKLGLMKDWPVPREHLRVCTRDEKTADGSACYECVKCLNTLLYLELLGIREHFPGFPRPLTRAIFARICWLYFLNGYQYSWLIRAIRLGRRFDLFLMLGLMFGPVKILGWLRRQFLTRLPKQRLYEFKKRAFGAQPTQ
jgi:hypothetical protein